MEMSCYDYLVRFQREEKREIKICKGKRVSFRHNSMNSVGELSACFYLFSFTLLWLRIIRQARLKCVISCKNVRSVYKAYALTGNAILAPNPPEYSMRTFRSEKLEAVNESPLPIRFVHSHSHIAGDVKI